MMFWVWFYQKKISVRILASFKKLHRKIAQKLAKILAIKNLQIFLRSGLKKL
jgi:hypothetical protein